MQAQRPGPGVRHGGVEPVGGGPQRQAHKGCGHRGRDAVQRADVQGNKWLSGCRRKATSRLLPHLSRSPPLAAPAPGSTANIRQPGRSCR